MPDQRFQPQDGTAPHKAPRDAPAQDITTAPQRATPQVEDLLFMDALQDDSPDLTSPYRQSTRHSSQPNRLEYDFLGTPKGLKYVLMQVKSSQHGSKPFNCYCVSMVS